MGSVMVDIQAIQEAVDTEIPTLGSGRRGKRILTDVCGQNASFRVT